MEKLAETQSTKIQRRNSFVGVFLICIVIFLILPLFTSSFYVHVALQACFAALIILTLCTISDKWLDVMLGMCLALPFVILDLVSSLRDSLDFMIAAYFFYCAFLILSVIVISKQVLVKELIDTNLVFGVITVYLLIGIIWSKLYFLVDAFLPNSFHDMPSLDYANRTLHNAFDVHFDLLYYSFTTLSTLGMGDIAPEERLTKSLTMLEAMFGQLFVATVIAKVVSVWHKKR